MHTSGKGVRELLLDALLDLAGPVVLLPLPEHDIAGSNPAHHVRAESAKHILNVLLEAIAGTTLACMGTRGENLAAVKP